MREIRALKSMAISNAKKRARGWPTGNWPRCEICGKGVDSVGMEHETRRTCEIRAKCHGAEDTVKLIFNWDWQQSGLTVPLNWVTFFPVEDIGTKVIVSGGV